MRTFEEMEFKITKSTGKTPDLGPGAWTRRFFPIKTRKPLDSTQKWHHQRPMGYCFLSDGVLLPESINPVAGVVFLLLFDGKTIL